MVWPGCGQRIKKIGEMSYGFASKLRDALPQASLIIQIPGSSFSSSPAEEPVSAALKV